MKPRQSSLLTPDLMEWAFACKDASYDGLFYAAVRTTGVFCRPSCPSRPKSENLEFFTSPRECLEAGYRPCLRCKPLESCGAPPEWVGRLLARLKTHPSERLKADDLRELGVTPERARRWFKEHYGMSFAAWSRRRRVAGAYRQIQEGSNLDDVVFESGYESHSGFREAFGRLVGAAPGRVGADLVVTSMVETPIGPMLAGVKGDRICSLEFAEGQPLERRLEALERAFKCGVAPGGHPILERLREELAAYFAGQRRDFSLPVTLKGTEFQEKVWEALIQIPYGETISYEELAHRVGRPTACRAVALANGMNRISILVPCHRVIGKNGTLTGYGGGLWRKRLLLRLESDRSD